MSSDDTSVSNDDIFKRDRYKCRNCERKGGDKGDVELHAHHIVPKERGGQDILSNLVTLCRECHQSVHQLTSAPTVKYAKLSKYTDTVSDRTDNNRHDKNNHTRRKMRLDDFNKKR